jgi:hypothetical protein
LQGQQVHVLADALVERSGAEQGELAAQKGDGLQPFSAGREHLSVDFDRGAQRRGEPAIAVQWASAEEFESQFAGFGGVRLGLVESLGVERAAGQPGKRGGELRSSAGSIPIGLDCPLRAGEIVPVDETADAGDQGGEEEERGQDSSILRAGSSQLSAISFQLKTTAPGSGGLADS